MPYDKIILQEILLQEDFRTLDSNGRILPPTNGVYKRVADRMALRGSHIEPRHVYTIINEDRNGFKTLIAATYKINSTEQINVDTSNKSADSTNDSNEVLSESLFSKQIKLVISAESWSQISPRKKVSSARIYWKLGEGWSDVIAERICQQHGSIDCVFSFKNNLVTPSATAKSYATFVGHCVECQSKITGRLPEAPAKAVDVIFLCNIVNIRPGSHTGKKKRQLRGKRREKVANELIDQRKDAITFQREEAKRMKKFGGKNLPIVPNAPTLRKAKEQQLLKLLGLESANPPLNLLRESESGKFAGSIHSISLRSFYCIYWSPEQQQIYTARCQGNLDAVLTIDATGGIAKRTKNHDPHVFLYQCMVVTKEGSVPVFQMVSADQKSFIIGHFLKFILTRGAPRPPTVICDFGRALVNAVAEVFGKCNDLYEYLQKCYNGVVRSSAEIPASYIRLDVSHFVAMVSRWKCLRVPVIAARRFFIRCICQAYQMHDFELVTDFIESVLAVALSETIGFTTEGDAVPAELRMQALNNTIKGVTVEELENDMGDSTNTEDSEESEEEKETIDTDWYMWGNSRYSNAEEIARKSKGGNTINACFNPEFAQRLKKQLLPFLPLWTNIMRRHFGRGSTIATSSSVESEFADLKGRTFGGKLPMRIDKFVLHHLDYLDGKVKLASNQRDLPSLARPNLKDDSDILHTTGSSIHISEKSESDNVNSGFYMCDIKHSDIEDLGQDVSEVFITSDNANVEDNHEEMLKKDGNIFSSTVNECSAWNSLENWRRKAEKDPNTCTESDASPVKKRRKPSYLDTCPEWDYVKNAKVSKLPAFKNGLLCQPVITGALRFNLKRTCAFDSLFQLILNGMALNDEYTKALKNLTNKTIQLALKILTDKQKISSAHYKERAEVLMNTGLFKIESCTSKIKHIDTECNVAHLAQYVFNDVPSYTTQVVCPCGYNLKHQSILFCVNIDVILCQGFGAMQQAIDDGHQTQRTCRICKNVVQDHIEYGPHLIIDTSVITDDRYTNRNNNLHHTLGSIASTVKLRDKTYSLTGTVHWSEGHYVAYTKSGMYWHEYNDLGPTRESVSAKKIIQPHLILYTLIEVEK